MLVLMLVVATTFRFCPLVKAQPLCRWGCPSGPGVLPGVGDGADSSGRKLGKMLRSPTSLRIPSLLDTHFSLPPHAFQPITKSSHCHLKTLA